MDASWKAIVWHQFGAALDMLENAMEQCPEELWSDRTQRPEFWYVAFHTLFWLDLYLHGRTEGFAPPQPFGLEELDPAGILPERPYTKRELHDYLEHGRRKCRATIDALTDERAGESRHYGWGEASFAELLLYNMRHVQHHTAQLNLILRQRIDSAPGWVAQAKSRGEGPAPRSPRITHVSWGRMEVEGVGAGKDFKLYPGGGRAWDWSETGTRHIPGIQPADVVELLDKGSEVVVLSRGMELVLQTCPETLALLRERGVAAHVEETRAAVALYNALAETRPVGGLFHSTC